MADSPNVDLFFEGGCPDCGRREVKLPRPLPELGDDFDWQVRDYDGFRLFMMQELAARFPERTRWTPADVEVALVEVLASMLDQFSDTLDRVSAEAFLETARQPASVRRLLELIGYDAVLIAGFEDDPDGEFSLSAAQKLDQFWLNHPEEMEYARRAGPREIRTQRRMVTLNDYINRLEEHPLVLRATSWLEWGGSWDVINVAVINWSNAVLDISLFDQAFTACLDDGQRTSMRDWLNTLAPEAAELWWDIIDDNLIPAGLDGLPDDIIKQIKDTAVRLNKLQVQINDFHQKNGLPEVAWQYNPAIRTTLRRYI
ncbi:MAG: hypothetical protein Q9M23_06545, partial [Mariprofundaceae bacterium]|nr:hypothetical protein [Mariprofundaceae bacterium]